MTDPINSPDFNPYTYREPNPETISQIQRLAEEYHAAKDKARELRIKLDCALRSAKEAGHSYGQLRDACGFSVATIQAIIEKG
jgi:hypothetical protein